MERKEQDLLLNMIGNPTSSIQDLMKGGLSVLNTSLEKKETYLNAASILSNPTFLGADGLFDPSKLDNSYKAAVMAYNYMSEDLLNKYIMDSAKYSSQNIFAPVKQRDYSLGFTYHKLENPNRITRGLIGVGRNSTPEFSESELALEQEVVDWKTGKKLPKPNGNWIHYLADTLVLAQYDKDVDINGIEEGQPGFDKDNIAHVKGERKLNENGTYYYETLGGRDVTGRKVLWKGDTLTTDGSWANRHLDFFDSDDIDLNSGGKTVLKNLALVGSMFIPGVGEYVALTSAALQTIGLFGTMGRMFTGDSSELARNLEGLGQSLNRLSGRTEASLANPWSMESFLNLTADVIAQLREQRAVFKLVPRLLGKGNISDEYTKELEAKYLAELNKASKVEFNPNTPINLLKTVALQKELLLANLLKAAEMVREYTKNYYNLGGDISKVYMTGITVQNAYGEAILQGADPLSAFLYTLGYGWGEWRLLNTGIGEWILPELRMLSAEHKLLIKTLFPNLILHGKDLAKAGTKQEKSKIIHKLVNLGKLAAHTDYSIAKGMMSNTVANALGEGIEEVSEEFLADISKLAYNLVSWFTGSDVKLDAWKDMGNRYALSFFGGALGGSLAGIGLDNLRYAHALRNMTTEQATLKLVAISRDPEQREKFLENLEKLDLGASNLSAHEYETDESGNFIGFKPGTVNDNQDKFAKDIIKQQLNFIDNILEANGGKLKDESVLKDVIQDVRFAYLTQTNAGNRVISRYNTIMSKIVEATQKLKNINSPQNQTVNGDKDLKGEESPTTENQRKLVEEELKLLIKEKDDLLSGKYSAELALESLIELNPYVMDKLGGMSAIRYAETRAGMSYDQIPDNLKDKYLADYKNIAETNGKDTVALLSQAYLQLSNVALPAIQQVYDLLQNPLGIETAKLALGLATLLDALNTELLLNGSEAFLSAILSEIDDLSVGEKSLLTLMEGLYTPELRERLVQMANAFRNAESKEEKDRLIKEHNEEYVKIAYETLIPLIKQTINTGYLDSVTRSLLLDSIEVMLKNRWNLTNEQMSDLFVLKKLLSDISKVKHTPIEQILDKFILDANLSDIRFTGLIDTLYKLYNDVRKDVAQFLPSEGLLERLGEAIQLLDLFEGIVYGARTDQLGIDVLLDSGTRETKVNENYFGINGIVKNLAETYGADDLYKALPTIDGRLADLLMQDIGTLKKQLAFYYDLMAINSGQKLSKLSRVDTNLSYLLYKAVKNFVITIPDDWKDKDKLEGALSSMVFTEENYLSGKNSLTEEELITLEKEKLSMMLGLHEFFKTNKEKVDNVEELAKLLSADSILLTGQLTQTLTENTTEFDGHLFIAWLSSIAALDPTTFFGNYKDVIASDIAPVPGLELGIYLATSNILNGSVITKFVEATLKSLYNYFINLPDKEKLKKIFDIFKFPIDDVAVEDWPKVFNNTFYPLFKNTILIEGIPGSGKTKAVLEVTKRILKSNSDISNKTLNKVWYVHTDSKKAEGLSSEKNKNDEFFGHLGLIEKISTWNKLITNDSFYFDETGVIRPKVDFKHLDNLPLIIFIDEVSKYNILELKVIDEFALSHGIPVIVLGDFDQSPERLTILVPFKGRDPGNMKLLLYRTTFFSPIKLGDSFRTTNNQKEKNLAALQIALESEDSKNVPIHYHYDLLKGLFGDMIYNMRNNTEEDETPTVETLKKDGFEILDVIKTMFATTNEKIGFIYSDENGVLARELLKPEYADKIIRYPGNFAQGDEALYFIIDGPTNDDLDLNDFYTGVTRSALGTLIYINYENSEVVKGDKVIGLDTILDKVTYDSSLPGKSIADYSEKRKKRLEKIYEGKEVEPLKCIERKNVKLNENQLLETSVSAIEPVTPDGEELNPESVVLTPGFASPVEVALSLEKATVDGNPPDTKAKVHADEDNPDAEIVIDLALYSHASSELGFTDWSGENKNGVPVLSDTEQAVLEKRLDSAYGLYKLLSLEDLLNKTKLYYIDTLASLRSILLSYRRKSDIEEEIGEKLNLSSPYVTFAIKNSANPTTGDINVTDSDYDRFAKGTYEELEDVFVQDERAHLANRRQLIAIIGNGDTDVLEIPLGTLSSPITIIKTNSELADVAATFLAAFIKHYNPYEGIQAVIDTYKTIPRYKLLIDLCTLWINTGNVVGYIKNPLWTPINALLNEGGQVDLLKGLNQARMDILQYDARTEPPIPLLNYMASPTFTVSPVIIPKRTIYKNGRKIFAGYPIILWTSNSLIALEELEEIFINEDNPDVKFAYVNLPDFSISEYLQSLLEFVQSPADAKVPPIGSILSSFLILSELMKTPDFKDILKELLSLSGEEVYETLQKVLKDIDDTIKPDPNITDEFERKAIYNRDLVNKLFSSSPLFSGNFWLGGNQSIASLFQKVFISITLNINRTTQKRTLIDKNVKKLEALCGNKRVLAHAKPKEDWGTTNTFMLMDYNQDNYTLNDKKLTIKSKLTGKAFFSETGDINTNSDSLMSIITYLVNEVFYTENSGRKSKDNANYINRSSKLNNKSPEELMRDKMETSAKKLGLSILNEDTLPKDSSIVNILETYANYISQETDKYLALPLQDDLFIIEMDEDKVSKEDLTVVKPEENIYEFRNGSDKLIYRVDLTDLSNPKLEAPKVEVLVLVNTEITLPQIKSNMEEPPSGPAKLIGDRIKESVNTATDLIDLINKLSEIKARQAILYSLVIDRMFPEASISDLLKTLSITTVEQEVRLNSCNGLDSKIIKKYGKMQNFVTRI